ncbi:MAG: hypothetical protein H6934_06850 [Burkholderiaceae bacterium]|nr:hypothetical protein [Burkholderiaceae bacterium]
MAAALLGACSPTYNWREIRPEGGGFAVMVPARPSKMSRAIDLDGLAVTMTMHGARVDPASYTVGVVDLPEDSARVRAHAVDAMRRGMLRNIGAADDIALTATSVPFGAIGATAKARIGATMVRASGRRGDQALQMVAVFVARGQRAWQAVAIGSSLPDASTRLFTDSLRLLP